MSKDKRWVNPNDPGILRKKNEEDTDLFLFGYGCKLFRDDQKALEMDQGKHLIPWMGDESLKIDRYDARGHLSDLTPYEGPSENYVPTLEDRRIESLCDEERYRALNVNEEESQLYQEEELKRLKQLLNTDKTYGQVAYQYSDSQTQQMSQEKEKTVLPEDEDEPFIPSPLLDIPENMQLPKTLKENQRIEKTAAHVASHGPQVEILIKTRQANNPKLNFLHVNSPLNPYYHFILSQIKTGRYRPGSMDTHSNSDSSHDHYLHPSLASTVESAPSIPSIPYKPSSDCAYNALVKSIRNVQEAAEGAREERSSNEVLISPPEQLLTPPELLLTPPDLLHNSPGNTNPKRKRKRHYGPEKGQPSQEDLNQEPSFKAKKLISGMVKYAHRNNQDPAELLQELGDSNVNFTQPGHIFYEYYKKQLEETFKENNISLANPNLVDEMGNVMITSEDNSSAYDPEKPTSDDVETSMMEGQKLEAEENDCVTKVIPQPVPNGGKKRVPPPPPPRPATTSDIAVRVNSKPAPVSFSIKKSKEERLEHASVFPLEESSSEEEGEEVRDSQPKSEIEKQKSEAEKQTSKEEHVKDKPVQIARDNFTAKDKNRGRKSEKLSSSVQSCSGESSNCVQDTQKEQELERLMNGKHSLSHSADSTTKELDKRTGAKSKEKSRKEKYERKLERVKKQRDFKDVNPEKEQDKSGKKGEEEAPLPPLPEEPALLPPLPPLDLTPPKDINENQKKKEERKKKVRQMLAKLEQSTATEVTGSIEKTKDITSNVNNNEETALKANPTWPSVSFALGSSKHSKSSPRSKPSVSGFSNYETITIKIEEDEGENINEGKLRQRVKKILAEFNQAAQQHLPSILESGTSTPSLFIKSVSFKKPTGISRSSQNADSQSNSDGDMSPQQGLQREVLDPALSQTPSPSTSQHMLLNRFLSADRGNSQDLGMNREIPSSSGNRSSSTSDSSDDSESSSESSEDYHSKHKKKKLKRKRSSEYSYERKKETCKGDSLTSSQEQRTKDRVKHVKPKDQEREWRQRHRKYHRGGRDKEKERDRKNWSQKHRDKGRHHSGHYSSEKKNERSHSVYSSGSSNIFWKTEKYFAMETSTNGHNSNQNKKIKEGNESSSSSYEKKKRRKKNKRHLKRSHKSHKSHKHSHRGHSSSSD